MSIDTRLIVVSNRLPFRIVESEGALSIERSSGGLVSALLPLFKRNGGCWIGWPGTSYSAEIEQIVSAQHGSNYSLRPVFLTAEEKECFYHGYCNEIIWPLFHDLQSKCTFDPRYWVSYREANDKFAHSTAQVAQKDDFIWVHDYHLMLLARALRARSLRNEIGYFHHIPFPQPDIFEKLPWRIEIARALLRFDSIGFQTERDRRNFLTCVRRFVPEAHVQKSNGRVVIQSDGTYTVVGTYPIGIDFEDFATRAAEKSVTDRAHEIRQEFPDCRLIIGVDRLDYTKGVIQRLLGLRTLLRSDRTWLRRVQMVQVVVPSREEIPEYRQLREQIENLIAEMNAEFGDSRWVPVKYVHGSLSRPELLALYRAADIALVTPLKDGMNLVAKEFCAVRVDEGGVLVLSEFAGAAAELSCGALLINPYDSQGIAAALSKGLQMSRDQQQVRMQRMREVVGHNNIFDWCRAVCALESPLLRQGRRPGNLQLPGRMAQYAARAV
ncbi:MAG: trehalose-6-phosphate synthase [Terriglobia bacterium]|jgi:trehalose 6-phosphate synthase|nr:trehalose-6-phosphate synthase [Terriglobia bacterium]